MSIRLLEPSDFPAFVELFYQLADHDGTGRHNIGATEANLHEAIFGPSPMLNVLVSESANEIVGIATWVERYAARAGRNTIWLSDLYVKPSVRRQGHGRALMQALSEVCLKNDYCRIEWKVPAGTDDAVSFYRSSAAVESDMSLWELSAQNVSGQ